MAVKNREDTRHYVCEVYDPAQNFKFIREVELTKRVKFEKNKDTVVKAKCKNGCEMEEYEAQGNSCNGGCGARYHSLNGKMIMRCRDCDYDNCMECFKKRAKTDVKKVEV